MAQFTEAKLLNERKVLINFWFWVNEQQPKDFILVSITVSCFSNIPLCFPAFPVDRSPLQFCSPRDIQDLEGVSIYIDFSAIRIGGD